MALEYVVTKRVFGFDESKTEKYVAKSVRSGQMSFSKTCARVSRICGVHRKVVDLVVSGLVDMMAEDIDDGKSVQLGEFGIFRPTIKAKSANSEEGVKASSIVRKRIVFTPGKIFQRTLNEMSVTRSVPADTDYTDGSSSGNTGGNTSGGNTGGGDIDDNPLG
ncbi:HU family DNA-binding protein [Bacteroides sp. UBA939]|uniref:HU family DNA-binding protein n=1 Tax=Bacteroides sp. UBA939 TaxID=1946092 RepID=UPI0025C5E150|nr:HU family DNA-binding protein [Bacteroides sp. UBA939]